MVERSHPPSHFFSPLTHSALNSGETVDSGRKDDKMPGSQFEQLHSRPEERDNNSPSPTGALELIINGVYVTQEFSYWTSSRLRQQKFSHIIYVDRGSVPSCSSAPAMDDLDPNEFECLELNFDSALVLPNLYRSDKFIAKALANEGKVLILEAPQQPQGNRSSCQKCLAIILGYLMYNFELSFWHAYETLRKIYRPKFELDHFLVIQLYEYEPILEVRRAAEEMGHSRSGERLRSVLKRTSCALVDNCYEDETVTVVSTATTTTERN